MKRVTTIDGVVLDYSLFISTEFDIDDYIGSRSLAIDGSSVMFVQPKGAMTNEVMVYSKNNSWVLNTTKDLLIATVDDLPKTVIFDDLSEATYYYDHSTIPMSFTPIFEGSCWYTVEINLLKG